MDIVIIFHLLHIVCLGNLFKLFDFFTRILLIMCLRKMPPLASLDQLRSSGGPMHVQNN